MTYEQQQGEMREKQRWVWAIWGKAGSRFWGRLTGRTRTLVLKSQTQNDNELFTWQVQQHKRRKQLKFRRRRRRRRGKLLAEEEALSVRLSGTVRTAKPKLFPSEIAEVAAIASSLLFLFFSFSHCLPYPIQSNLKASSLLTPSPTTANVHPLPFK